MGIMKRMLLGAFVALLVQGCAGMVETKVTAFHDMVQPIAGITYAIVPSKEQEGSLEFQAYSKLVKAELDKRGMAEAPFEQAKYAVFMLYGIDDGKQVVESYPIFGQTGTSGARTTGSVNVYGNTATYNATTTYTPTYGIVGSGTRSNTVFKRYLNIDLIDISKSGDGKVHKVYEGKASSKGSSGQLALVMPAIVKSVFEDFPGKNGVVRTVQQPLEK